MSHKFPFLIVLILAGTLFLANFAFAWEVTWPEIPGTEFVVGNRCPVTGCPPEDLPGFIAYIFTFALVTAGIVALGTLIWGAIQFVASAGFPGLRNEAKSRMTGAVTGLLLLLAVYIILNTINPELVMPGLGLGPKPVVNLPINLIFGEPKIGVTLYEDVNCNADFKYSTYTQAVPNLTGGGPVGNDADMNDIATAFKIGDSGIMVNFYEGINYSGTKVSIEGPTGPCVKLSDYLPNLTQKISSLNFLQLPPGVTICKTSAPKLDDETICKYLSYSAGAPAEKVNYGHGSPNSPRITILTPSYFDLGSVNSAGQLGMLNETRWIGVAPGYYGVLCADRKTDDTNDDEFCFFILKSVSPSLYGDRFGGAFSLLADAETVIIHGSNGSCKGVIFHTGNNFNRDVWGWPLFSEETVTWPLGLGDISSGSADPTPDTTSYNYTRISDLNNFDEIDWGLPGPDISSLELIGNCKLQVFDAAGFAGNNTVFKKNIRELFSELAGLPIGQNWDNKIRSFVLCAEGDIAGLCSF